MSNFILQSTEEFVSLLELTKAAFEDGTVVPLDKPALLRAELVTGYKGAEGMRLMPRLRNGVCFTSDCILIHGKYARVAGSEENNTRSQFLAGYFAMQGEIAWDAPGAGVLLDPMDYRPASDGTLPDENAVALWLYAVENARLTSFANNGPDGSVQKALREYYAGTYTAAQTSRRLTSECQSFTRPVSVR